MRKVTNSKRSAKRAITQRAASPRKGARALVGPRIQWKNLGPRQDYWGQELKRYFNLDTLTNACEYHLKHHDRFIAPSIRRALGPSPITSMHFELFQEGRHQLIFKLGVANRNRKRQSFAFVVAKNSQEHSAVAQNEHRCLEVLHARVPQCVVRPYLGGTIYLPERHERGGERRLVYAYLTQWLGGFDELGIQRNREFFINTRSRRVLTKADREAIKRRIIEIIVRTYDPKERDCMEMPQLASGDFVISRPKQGPPQLRLIACRRMLRRMTPSKLLNTIATARWRVGNGDFHLLPEDPAELRQALTNALGKSEALRWLENYSEALRRKRFAGTRRLPRSTIDAIRA